MEDFAVQYGLPYCRVSSRTGKGVRKLFNAVAAQLIWGVGAFSPASAEAAVASPMSYTLPSNVSVLDDSALEQSPTGQHTSTAIGPSPPAGVVSNGSGSGSGGSYSVLQGKHLVGTPEMRWHVRNPDSGAGGSGGGGGGGRDGSGGRDGRGCDAVRDHLRTAPAPIMKPLGVGCNVDDEANWMVPQW